MTTDNSTPAPDPEHDDQDAEPTLNAPEEGRPDGAGALKDEKPTED